MRSSKTDELVEIELSRQKYSKIRKKDAGVNIDRLKLRLVKHQIDGDSFTLGTTLPDSEKYPARELAELYYERWDIEE
jgi:IS4 transposase